VPIYNSTNLIKRVEYIIDLFFTSRYPKLVVLKIDIITDLYLLYYFNALFLSEDG